MEIKNAQQILTYLNDLSYTDDSEIKDLIQLIEKSRFDLSQKTVSMVKLSHYRILSSNSLKKKDGLEGWDRANKYIFQEIAKVSKINKEHILKINGLLNNRETKDFRSDEIYSAQWQYLPQESLATAWLDFEKNILSMPNSILRSCEIYIWLVTMHSFTNGNGRTARLVADWSLLEQSYLPLCFDSSVASHVAVVIGDKLRDKKSSIKKTLSAILRAYEISLN
jgi:Fic family protein